MKPTEILMEEHRVIEQVLSCLEKMADLCESEGKIEAQPAHDAVAFFRNFADRCHHAKEEAELFPVMEVRGFSPDQGPTAVMRSEHVRGRAYVNGIEESIDGAARGDVQAVRAFVRQARSYVQMLREHIQKEDDCLFPMAAQALSGEDWEKLAQRFDQVEHEEIGDAVHEQYHRIADELADRFGVPRASLHH